MNKAQRKALDSIIYDIEALDLSSVEANLQEQQEAEQEKFDNLSEGLQQSEMGQTIEAAANALEEALDAIQEAIGNLEAAVEAIGTAQE
jgi:hypothetical protein